MITKHKRHSSPKALLILVLALLTGILKAQELRLDTTADGKGDSGYQAQWDSAHSRLLLYRDVSSQDIPAARIFRSDGSSVPVFLLRDFRDASFADVWAASATPQGGMVLSVVLGFGQRPNPADKSKPFPALRSLLLTYDSNGDLKKVWNVAPYQHQALAVDLEGSVFALGTRDAGPEGFPALIKYSPSGKVLVQFAPSTLFAGGGSALDGDPLNGSPSLFIRNQQIVLWVPSTQEIFRFNPNGELQRKVALKQTLGRLAKQNQCVRATLAGLAVTDAGDFTAQVRLWPTETSAQGILSGMVTLATDGADAKLTGALTPASQETQRFLGISEDSRPVFLERTDKPQILVRKH